MVHKIPPTLFQAPFLHLFPHTSFVCGQLKTSTLGLLLLSLLVLHEWLHLCAHDINHSIFDVSKTTFQLKSLLWVSDFNIHQSTLWHNRLADSQNNFLLFLGNWLHFPAFLEVRVHHMDNLWPMNGTVWKWYIILQWCLATHGHDGKNKYKTKQEQESTNVLWN